jgi:hypothetical protein
VDLDPLGLVKTARPKELANDYSPTDLERLFLLPPSTYIGNSSSEKWLPLRDIINRLEVCHRRGAHYPQDP